MKAIVIEDGLEHVTPVGFGKWRQRLFPVHSSEKKKFFSLLSMKCCLSFIYTILHATKDTVIVTSKNSGAEAIPILKGWFVLIFSFIFMLVYSKLSNHLSRTRLFYVTIAPFLLFFIFYGFFLFPNRDILSPHATADWITQHIGTERAHWVAVYRYWMDSLFFLAAELWGGVVIGLLFWGFANRINTLHEASRFYSLLSAGGHIGLIFAGPLIWYFSQKFAAHEFIYTVQWLMGLVSISGILILALYWWINRFTERSEEGSVVKEKATTKLSIAIAHQGIHRESADIRHNI